MAKKEEKTKVDNKLNSENTIIKETITYDNKPIFNKILVCLYIIIALLAINTIVLAIKGNGITTSSYSNTNNSDNNSANNNSANNNSANNNSADTDDTDVATYDVSSFKEITADEFVDAYNGDEYQLIYLGRSDCGWCRRYVPVLTEVQNKYKFQALYLDVNKYNRNVGTEGMNKIIALDEEFFTNENTAYGATPSTLIVKDGEIVDYQIGASDASTLETLVSKYFDKK